MALTDSILGLKDKPTEEPKSSWVQELIERRSGGDPRKKRNPVGFDFKREPFDPSSYYRALGTFRDISRAATNVTRQEVQNREEARMQREFEASQQAMNDALGGVDPRFTYGDNGSYNGASRKYGLRSVSSNTAKAADYFGGKYGVKNVGGFRSKGSVPGSDHPKGRALDFMTYNDKKKGNALAQDVISNYKKWNVKYVIWNRYIWQPGRGWKKYNGPSPHTDHVHVSFNK